MFDSTRTSLLARRARAALSLARSFLLLEDDYDVDWEVDQDEPCQGELRAAYLEAAAASDRVPRDLRAVGHPHRAQIRRRARVAAARRAGQPAPKEQLCLCPVNRAHQLGIGISPAVSRACAGDSTASRRTG
jgi:hypothetical protein